MSATLANLDKFSDNEASLSSGALTARNSHEFVGDDEKLSVANESQNGDNPAPLSKARLVLLMLGLSLSMFLVALDFVRSISIFKLNALEYFNNCNP